jgi:hypothetical protein
MSFCAIAPSASANTTYGLAQDFSITQNGGSNPWSYGLYGNGFGPYTLTPANFQQFNTATTGAFGALNVWGLSSSADSGGDPNIEKNVTNSVNNGCCGIYWEPQQVAFGPYLGPTVARFTVPTTGPYTVSAMFQDIQSFAATGNTAPTGYIYEGSSQLAVVPIVTGADSSVASGGLGGFATFSSGPMELTAGTTLDFITYGANANNATTEVIADVILVPEPSSLVALCGLGAAGMVLALRRRRRK